jgi:hypothetical protein
MALANYSDLVSAISTWTHRGDLASVAPDFITLAEQRIYHGKKHPLYASNPLRLRIMEEQDSGNAANGVIAIPSGYLETIRLTVTTGGRSKSLTYRAPSANAPWESEAGTASFFTRVNEGLKIGPVTAAYVHDYYKRFDALTAQAATNALLTNHPDLYLYGALHQAWLYVGNKAKADWAYEEFMSAVNGLSVSDKKHYGNAPAVVAVS